jgi:hypothetical protein
MSLLDDLHFEPVPPPRETYWGTVPTNEEIDVYEEIDPPRRGRAKDYSGDGITNVRMTQTEVALRLARHLAESPLLDGIVFVQIGGAEVNRRGDDVAVFPVRNYLSRWGFTKDRGRAKAKPKWIGFYTSSRSRRKLLLNFDKHDGHVTAVFADGRRLIVHCTAGNVGNTRSPAEHHDMNRAVGRAICWAGAKPDDVIAVCTPRSTRFRKMAAERSTSAGVKKVGLLFLNVDRGGGIQGLSDAPGE